VFYFLINRDDLYIPGPNAACLFCKYCICVLLQATRMETSCLYITPILFSFVQRSEEAGTDKRTPFFTTVILYLISCPQKLCPPSLITFTRPPCRCCSSCHGSHPTPPVLDCRLLCVHSSGDVTTTSITTIYLYTYVGGRLLIVRRIG
jgi:hypothetical protein